MGHSARATSEGRPKVKGLVQDLDTENDPWGTTKDIDVLHRSSVISRTGEHRDAIEEPYADIFSAKDAMVFLFTEMRSNRALTVFNSNVQLL
eukprot:scaffold68518_cov35-Attheya_sp.AAC.1